MAARPSSPAASGTSSSNHAITSLIETINIFVEENDEEENIDLWDSFREEFANYTEQDLHATGRHTLTKLRRFLRTHGVFVERGSHIKIAKALRNLIDVDEYPRWTMNEVTATEGEGPIKSTLLQDYLNRGTTERKRTPEARSSRAASPAAEPAQPAVRASPRQLPFEPPQPQPGPQLLAQPQQTQHDHRSPNPQAQFLTPQYNPQAQLARNTQYQTQDARFQDQDAQLHAQYRPGTQFTATQYGDTTIDHSNSASTTKMLSDFSRMITEDMKYSGENDYFDLKYNAFINTCERTNLPRNMRSRAYPAMLKGAAIQHYYNSIVPSGNTNFDAAVLATRNYFEGPERQRRIYNEWSNLTLQQVMTETSKNALQALDVLVQRLRDGQHGLPQELRNDQILHSRIISACQGVDACKIACSLPPPTVPALISSLKDSIDTAMRSHSEALNSDAFFTDRRYYRNDNNRGQRYKFSRGRSGARDSSKRRSCYVCKKEGCRSWKHSRPEQEAAKQRFLSENKAYFAEDAERRVMAYLATQDDESSDEDNGDDLGNIIEGLLNSKLEDNPGDESHSFMTSCGPVSGEDLVTALTNCSFQHALTPTTPVLDQQDPFSYIQAPARYNKQEFYGVMIDTGASMKSTAGYGQFIAYQNIVNIKLDSSTAGQVNIQFGIGSTSSMGSICVETPIGSIIFHVVDADTPFLLSLTDMDHLGVYYDNVQDLLVKHNARFPVSRRFGHPFLLWGPFLSASATFSTECMLTEVELRRLHRRFGHPSAARLYNVLRKANQQDVSQSVIERITDFCHHCQKHGKSPGRFKFTLREDLNFNSSIIIDIMYIDNNPVLHIVDEATRFQAARWLKNITSSHVWDCLRSCWIDTYLGPPDVIVHDAGKTFISKEFRQNAAALSSIVKEVPVEAHWSIGIVERYHAVLRRAFRIIVQEISTTNEMALQMSCKAVNDTAGPDGLVPTLLVFGAYPRMSQLDPPAPTIAQRAQAISKAMAEVRKAYADRQVREALATRNGPSTTAVLDLPLQSDVLVWREGNTGHLGTWSGPFKLIATEGETCTISMPSGPVKFRSTVVKPYLNDETDAQIDVNDPEEPNPLPEAVSPVPPATAPTLEPDPVPPAGKRGRGRPRKHPLPAEAMLMDGFQASRQKEISGLMEKGVFNFVKRGEVPEGTRIFGSRFVDDIKNKGTDKAFEKSRLVIQAFNDHGKDLVLTESPTIQRVSQRLILCLAATCTNLKIYLRDISQAYVQSTTVLNRDFYAYPPKELKLSSDIVLKVIKPLYGIPEAGNHWFNTYHNHHTQKLKMQVSTFDPCLLSTCGKGKGIGIIGLQTDDTIILADDEFAATEEEELQRAGFTAKAREQLTASNPLRFNGGEIKLHENGSITLAQPRQCQNLQSVSEQATDISTTRNVTRRKASMQEQYIAQRARGAYIATVCQPEAAFDLSIAAQTTTPTMDDARALNKRIRWQKENKERGLTFVKLNPERLQVITFTDAAFANNKDHSSQIGYVVTLTDGERSNIVHWSSTKCKRVTRSVLAAELYGMANGFDVSSVIKSTIEQILQQPINLTICTDSKSLFDCLTKLGTTTEKRLMIDVMCLRQAYERRQIAEVKWIAGGTNPADALTKSKAGAALRELINSNRFSIKEEARVERLGESEAVAQKL